MIVLRALRDGVHPSAGKRLRYRNFACFGFSEVRTIGGGAFLSKLRPLAAGCRAFGEISGYVHYF
jgi:hypothetical protein